MEKTIFQVSMTIFPLMSYNSKHHSVLINVHLVQSPEGLCYCSESSGIRIVIFKPLEELSENISFS